MVAVNSGSPEPAMRWVRAESLDLAPWRNAVGPPAITVPGANGQPASDAIRFAVWNTGVGAADLSGFLSHLISGELTGGGGEEPTFVLLQEVHRGGASVPARPERPARGARRIHGRPGAGERERLGIDAVARRFGLHLYYVPSMRNGRPEEDAPPEDRGNAILSTLRLSHLRAFELPLERQRRVAIGARIASFSTGGARWTLDLVNVHLDPRSGGWRAHRSFGAGRARQARWLAGQIDAETPTFVGGDLNTWFRGGREAAVACLREGFPLPSPQGRRGTRPVLRGLSALELDHVLLRAPFRAEHRVLDDAYGSDHRPIVGRLSVA